MGLPIATTRCGPDRSKGGVHHQKGSCPELQNGDVRSHPLLARMSQLENYGHAWGTGLPCLPPPAHGTTPDHGNQPRTGTGAAVLATSSQLARNRTALTPLHLYPFDVCNATRNPDTSYKTALMGALLRPLTSRSAALIAPCPPTTPPGHPGTSCTSHYEHTSLAKWHVHPPTPSHTCLRPHAVSATAVHFNTSAAQTMHNSAIIQFFVFFDLFFFTLFCIYLLFSYDPLFLFLGTKTLCFWA